MGIRKKRGGLKVYRLHSAVDACGARKLPQRKQRLPYIGGLRRCCPVLKLLDFRREKLYTVRLQARTLPQHVVKKNEIIFSYYFIAVKLILPPTMIRKISRNSCAVHEPFQCASRLKTGSCYLLNSLVWPLVNLPTFLLFLNGFI